jgi:hypothetical protein
MEEVAVDLLLLPLAYQAQAQVGLSELFGQATVVPSHRLVQGTHK